MGIISDIQEIFAVIIVLILGIIILQAFVIALNFNLGFIIVSLFTVCGIFLILREVFNL